MGNFRRQEQGRQAMEESRLKEERFRMTKERKAKKKRKITMITIIALVIIISSVIFWVSRPGKYDDFAKCLTEKGAVMYGEDWCQYTNAQKNMFGKSFKHINYEVKQNLNLRPTWVIDGKSYETVQSFQRLSQLTGCKF